MFSQYSYQQPVSCSQADVRQGADAVWFSYDPGTSGLSRGSNQQHKLPTKNLLKPFQAIAKKGFFQNRIK